MDLDDFPPRQHISRDLQISYRFPVDLDFERPDTFMLHSIALEDSGLREHW